MTKETLGVDPTMLKHVISMVTTQVESSRFDAGTDAYQIENSPEFLRYIYENCGCLEYREPFKDDRTIEERRRWDPACILVEGMRMGQLLERLTRATQEAAVPTAKQSFNLQLELTGTAKLAEVH
jgi:hypothetical protein